MYQQMKRNGWGYVPPTVLERLPGETAAELAARLACRQVILAARKGNRKEAHRWANLALYWVRYGAVEPLYC